MGNHGYFARTARSKLTGHLGRWDGDGIRSRIGTGISTSIKTGQDSRHVGGCELRGTFLLLTV